MKIIGIIPARFGSTRYVGKPLKPILGKPMLQWVIEAAKGAKSLEQILVATDHPDIKSLAESCGVRAVMTDSDLPSGSDRVWAVAKGIPCDGVINIQGDEPLLEAKALDLLAEGLRADPSISMATLAKAFLNESQIENPNFAKIVVNQKSEAIYFSRLPIPFSRGKPTDVCGVLKHIGLYGYRKDFLEAFCKMGPVAIEKAEGLEQLRALWMGAKIKVIQTEFESWGVDTPEDVVRVEEILKARRTA